MRFWSHMWLSWFLNLLKCVGCVSLAPQSCVLYQKVVIWEKLFGQNLTQRSGKLPDGQSEGAQLVDKGSFSCKMFYCIFLCSFYCKNGKKKKKQYSPVWGSTATDRNVYIQEVVHKMMHSSYHFMTCNVIKWSNLSKYCSKTTLESL